MFIEQGDLSKAGEIFQKELEFQRLRSADALSKTSEDLTRLLQHFDNRDVLTNVR
jgi:hypothetical protein